MDNSHKSSCPICQRWFMVLFLKSEAKELALTVFPVNMKNPEPEFKEYHATPPVAVLVQAQHIIGRKKSRPRPTRRFHDLPWGI